MRNHKRTTPIFLSVLFVLFISARILETSIISLNEAVIKKK